MNLKAPQFWEVRGPLAYLLWPLCAIHTLLLLCRKSLYLGGIFKSSKLPVPVIFVGNIRVGGTGKTPCAIALAKALHLQGFKPGVISRGYRSSLTKGRSRAVLSTDSSQQVGDEALLMAMHMHPLLIPVWIGAERYATGLCLLQAHPHCDVIISDDGLQHSALARHPARHGGKDLELVVRDQRGEGNGWLMPAGPLRESTHRDRDITLLMTMAQTPHPSVTDVPLIPSSFTLMGSLDEAYQLIHPQTTQKLSHWKNQLLLAVAGIAAPQKFFDALTNAGLSISPLPLEDHADFTNIDFTAYSREKFKVILMTEKDAVKCQHLQDDRIWVVPLAVNLPASLIDVIVAVLRR